jgi:hypothetical protein
LLFLPDFAILGRDQINGQILEDNFAMIQEFPGAVPEIPVSNVDMAAAYYESHLGFSKDWGGEDAESHKSPREAAESF